MMSFLHHVKSRSSDKVRQNTNTSDNDGKPTILETGPDGSSDLPKKEDQAGRYSSSRSLFAKPMKHHRHREPEANVDFAKASTSREVEDGVKEVGQNGKSSTKSPVKKTMSFVKRLVLAFDRIQSLHCDEINESSSFYDDGPVMAYDSTGTIRKRKTSETPKDVPSDESLAEKPIQSAAVVKTKPKIVGAFLKKPIEIDETPVDWIPITGKTLPRKKSFKKLLAMLTGRSLEKRTTAKRVVFASQDNLVEEIQISEHEDEDSSSTSSEASTLVPFTETMTKQDAEVFESAHFDCSYSTFVKTSPVKIEKPGESSRPKLRFVDAEPIVSERFRFDSGYVSNYSISDESIQEKGLVAERVRKIGKQFAKIPKHPLARSDPWLHKEYRHCDKFSGGIVEMRNRQEEPIYDVPMARPQSEPTVSDESVSIDGKQAAPPVRGAFSGFHGSLVEEVPYYATIKPRCASPCSSMEKLPGNPSEISKQEEIEEKYVSCSSNDAAAGSSFVISMYV